jgi:hypothetical protein
MDLGTVGVWTTYRAIGEENAGEAAGLVERLGYGTFWLGGSPRLSSGRPLLEAKRRETLVQVKRQSRWLYAAVVVVLAGAAAGPVTLPRAGLPRRSNPD